MHFLRFAPPCASLARCSVPAHFVCSALQPFGPSPFCKRLHPQFAIVDLQLRTVPSSAARCSVAAHCASLRVLATSTLRVSDARKLACSSRCSLGLLRPVSATGGDLRAHPQFAMVVLLRLTACSTPASQFSMVASLRSQSSLEMLPASLGSSAAIAATGCAASFALIGLTSACFAHRARASCASSIRNGRPAAPDGLQYSLAHWAYFGLFRALRAAFVRPAKNARNDVYAVISDWNFFLSRPCQESGGVESQRPYRA